MNREPDDLDTAAAQLEALPVLAALAEGIADGAPPALRESVLRAVKARPRESVEQLPPAATFRLRASALLELLTDLTADEWRQRAAPYHWSVHGLVAHLLVIERYTAVQLGLDSPSVRADAGRHHLELGADDIARELTGDPHITSDRWWDAVQHIIEHVESDAFARDAPTSMHGWPFSHGSALVARAFELWTHADDIRRATGRPLDTPTPPELRTMSALSVASLPFIVPAVGGRAALPPTRIVLTGPGGGSFDIGEPGEPTVVLASDVLDYCRVAARRIEPDALDMTVEGDGTVVPTLLEAARAFAV